MGTTALWIIGLVVLIDLVFVPLLVYGITSAVWSPMVDRFPAERIAPDAVRRNFQSYRIGLVSLGLMVHTAVDESHLHLLPARLGRWCGMRPVSVPWQAVEPIKLGRRYAKVRIASETITGPAWALGLAFGGPEEKEERPHAQP